MSKYKTEKAQGPKAEAARNLLKLARLGPNECLILGVGDNGFPTVSQVGMPFEEARLIILMYMAEVAKKELPNVVPINITKNT